MRDIVFDKATQIPKKSKRLLISLIAVVLILAAAAGAYLFVIQSNQAAVAQIAGSWYCSDDGVKYVFNTDGTFNTTNGQTELLRGTWKAGWLPGSLIMSYTIDGVVKDVNANYTLSQDKNELFLLDINDKNLAMKRLVEAN